MSLPANMNFPQLPANPTMSTLVMEASCSCGLSPMSPAILVCIELSSKHLVSAFCVLGFVLALRTQRGEEYSALPQGETDPQSCQRQTYLS